MRRTYRTDATYERAKMLADSIPMRRVAKQLMRGYKSNGKFNFTYATNEETD